MVRREFFGAVLAAVSLALTASPSMAQRQGGQRGPGGFGGFGGMTSLLQMEEVQKELKLEQAQLDLLKGMANNRPQGDRPDFRNMSAEEREKYLTKRRTDQEKQLSEILDAKQMKRLKELDLQQSGARALDRADVAAALKLTPEQKTKIDGIQTAAGEQMRSMFQGQNFREMSEEQRTAMFTKMREATTANDAKILAVLTPAQKTQFESMKGAAFKFPERRFGGRRNN